MNAYIAFKFYFNFKTANEIKKKKLLYSNDDDSGMWDLDVSCKF